MASGDPIFAEILRNWFANTADEMSVALVRSAYSTTTKESQDASTALFDGEGRLIAQSSGTILLQLCSLRECLREILKDFPASEMHPGDVYVMNDPYRGGIHANDLAILAPVFVSGAVAYFTGALMHVADLGGIAPGGLPAQATDVYQEGLLLPPVVLVNAGRFNDSLAKVILLNSRTPQKVLGDISAMLGATAVGCRRVEELIGRYGDGPVKGVVDRLFDYAEDLTRRAIEGLPSGPMVGSYGIDDDGVDLGVKHHVRITIERHGSSLRIDLTGTDPQARGPINAAYSQSLSGILYGVRCFMDPSIPFNEGLLRPLEIILPLGTLVNPLPPAAVNARVVTVTAVVEAILDAVGAHDSDRSTAASSMNHVLSLSGTNPVDGATWLYYDADFGGIGARNGLDGVDASGAYFFRGRSHVLQLEALEAEYPVIFERYRLVRDSGGPGRWRGGLGVERAMRVVTDAEIGVRGDRMKQPPLGRGGGERGVGGSWEVSRGDRVDKLPSKKMGVRVKAGDMITMRTSGGGGYGRPQDRDASAVAKDVREGKVSEAAAAAAYGVHLTDGGEVDHARTLHARGRMSSES
jgi:N-methylhydantoinase B